MGNKLTINDLPPAVQQRLRQQIAAEMPKPKRSPRQAVNPKHWQGKELDFQHEAANYLHLMGFYPRTKRYILMPRGYGFRGWYVHVSRAIGNPYLLDCLLLHESGEYLEFELKNAKGKLSDIQQALVGTTLGLICRNMDEVRSLVTQWLELIERKGQP